MNLYALAVCHLVLSASDGGRATSSPDVPSLSDRLSRLDALHLRRDQPAALSEAHRLAGGRGAGAAPRRGGGGAGAVSRRGMGRRGPPGSVRDWARRRMTWGCARSPPTPTMSPGTT